MAVGSLCSYHLWLHHPHRPILQVSTFHSIWNHNWVGGYCLNVILTKFLNLALGSNFWVIVEHLCETWQKHLSCTKILLHVFHIIRTRWMFSRVDYLHVPYIENKIDQVCFLLCVFCSPVRRSWTRRWLTPQSLSAHSYVWEWETHSQGEPTPAPIPEF